MSESAQLVSQHSWWLTCKAGPLAVAVLRMEAMSVGAYFLGAYSWATRIPSLAPQWNYIQPVVLLLSVVAQSCRIVALPCIVHASWF